MQVTSVFWLEDEIHCADWLCMCSLCYDWEVKFIVPIGDGCVLCILTGRWNSLRRLAMHVFSVLWLEDKIHCADWLCMCSLCFDWKINSLCRLAMHVFSVLWLEDKIDCADWLCMCSLYSDWKIKFIVPIGYACVLCVLTSVFWLEDEIHCVDWVDRKISTAPLAHKNSRYVFRWAIFARFSNSLKAFDHYEMNNAPRHVVFTGAKDVWLWVAN